MALQTTDFSTGLSVRSNPGSGLWGAKAVCATVFCAVIAPVAVPIAILTSRRVQRALLAILVLNIPLQIGKHFLFQEDERGSFGGFEISLTHIALLGLYIGWLVERVRRGRSSRLPQRSKNTVLI